MGVSKLWLAFFGLALLEQNVSAAVLKKTSLHKRNVDADAAEDEDDTEDDAEDDDAAPVLAVAKAVQSPKGMINAGPPPTTTSTTTTTTTTEAAPTAPPPAVKPWAHLAAELAEVEAHIDRMRSEMSMWADHAEWNKRIAEDKKKVEEATTPELANMLGDIREEIHQLAVPVYTDVLQENMEALTERADFIRGQIEDMKNKQTSTKAQAPEVSKPEPAPKVANAESKAPEAEPFLLAVAFVVGCLVVALVSMFLAKK